jgi:heme-degrading monooxygenase HmoA
MFVAVYRWRLKHGLEEQFREAWHRTTMVAREQCGSLGSALFRAQDGSWVAIARWPDREARTRCFERGALDTKAHQLMREAILEKFEDLELESSDDLWVLPEPNQS